VPSQTQQPDPTQSHASPSRRGCTPSAWLDRLTPLDLRRARDAQPVDRVLARADWLAPAERDLVLAVLADARPIAQIARDTGANPRVLRRSFAGAVARLLDERTVFVASTLPRLRGLRARVARAHYLQGQTLRAIAQADGSSLHAVRAHRVAIESLYDAYRSRRQPRPATPTASPSNPTLPDRSWR